MMRIPDAIIYIVQHIRDTNKSALDAVKDTWDDLGEFSEDDARTLMHESLASRVSPIITNPFRNPLPEASETKRYAPCLDGPIVRDRREGERPPAITFQETSRTQAQQVSVQIQSIPQERYEVTIQVLEDVRYNVNGEYKSIAQFSRYDSYIRLEKLKAMERGVSNHRSVWEHIYGKLVTYDKKSVNELGHGEQSKIARMIYDVCKSRDPLEIELTNN